MWRELKKSLLKKELMFPLYAEKLEKVVVIFHKCL
nr:MAG TPA: hypothetical protein [Caudoviricetes sp.]